MADSTITFAVTLTCKLVKGEPTDTETLLDAFAATVGRQNTAQNPLRIEVGYEDDLETPATVYEVELVEDLGAGTRY